MTSRSKLVTEIIKWLLLETSEGETMPKTLRITLYSFEKKLFNKLKNETEVWIGENEA